jgi:CRP-like cAMP-binding protein
MTRGEAAARDLEGRWALMVVAGIVRLFVNAGGSAPTLSYHCHGALLGSHIVPADQSVAIDLEAVRPSIVVWISPQSVMDLMASNAEFRGAVMAQAQQLVGFAASALAARSTAKLPQRLAREIGLLAAMRPSSDLVEVTEQQLADGVGSIRESVARTLKAFRQRGWIATTVRGVIVLDREALEEVAKAGA